MWLTFADTRVKTCASEHLHVLGSNLVHISPDKILQNITPKVMLASSLPGVTTVNGEALITMHERQNNSQLQKKTKKKTTEDAPL